MFIHCIKNWKEVSLFLAAYRDFLSCFNYNYIFVAYNYTHIQKRKNTYNCFHFLSIRDIMMHSLSLSKLNSALQRNNLSPRQKGQSRALRLAKSENDFFFEFARIRRALLAKPLACKRFSNVPKNDICLNVLFRFRNIWSIYFAPTISL